jgi:hypothetical protein
VRTPKQWSAKADTMDALLSTTLRIHHKANPLSLTQKTNPLLLTQKTRSIRPASQGLMSSSHSPSKSRTPTVRITGPFTPNDPEMSMTIRPASLTQPVVKLQVRRQSASPSSRKRVQVKVPSTRV